MHLHPRQRNRSLPEGTGHLPLWQLTDVMRLFQLCVLALVMQGVAWFGASGTVANRDQLLWIVLAAAGIGVGGLASAMWLLSGLRAIRDRKQAVLQPLVDLAPIAITAPELVVADTELLVALPGHTTRYHLATCQLVARRDVAPEVAGRAAQEAAGRRACGVCLP